MNVLAVDLAAKYSAAMLMTGDRTVHHAWDSWQMSETVWIETLAACFMPDHWDGLVEPAVAVIEDLPHRLPHTTTTKAVGRLQGRIYDRFEQAGLASKIVFLDPATWRNTHKTLRGKNLGPVAVIETAANFGYEPPWEELHRRAKGNGGKTRAAKVASDYCSAFLIGQWAHKNFWNGFDVPGTSRYGEPQIRRPQGEADG